MLPLPNVHPVTVWTPSPKQWAQSDYNQDGGPEDLDPNTDITVEQVKPCIEAGA